MKSSECNVERSDATVRSQNQTSLGGNISAAKFPLLQTVRRRWIRRGTASTCWPRNEPLCFALRRTLCSNVCAPVFLNACRLCIVLSFGQLITRLLAPQRAALMKIPTIPGSFFCCVTVPSFASCVWLIELQLQLNYDSPHTLILWNFKAACVSLNPKSLWNDAKKYRCGISCRLALTNLDCGLFCQLTPLHSPQKHLKSISYWQVVCSAV